MQATKVYCVFRRKSDASIAWEGWARSVEDAWSAIEYRLGRTEYFKADSFEITVSPEVEFTLGKMAVA